MSIHNLFYKIKGKTGIDKVTLIYLFVIVGVGIGAFGLGRISALDYTRVKSDRQVTDNENLLENKVTEGGEEDASKQTNSQEKRYVASKNGKMYYSVGCSGAKRIKTENQVWFNTQNDAEKSGYSLSSSCK